MPYKNPEDKRAYDRAYGKTRDPIKRRASHSRWEKANPEAIQNKQLRLKYGITKADYDAKLAQQFGRCAICLQGERSKRHGKICALAVDHDHYTGKIRDLLCQRCNLVLGLMNEDSFNMHMMAHYIDRHNERA